MKKILLSVFAMMLAVTSLAQEKKMLTPMDASYNNRSVYPARNNFNSYAGTDRYLFGEGE